MREYTGGRPPKDSDEFWSNVDIRGKGECWIWKSKSKTYASFKGKHVHRIVCEMKYGKIFKYNSNGMKTTIRHTCNNMLCVNPHHIRLGTVQQNTEDYWRLEGNKALNKSKVVTARQMKSSGMTYLAISKVFNTTASTIRNAVIGKGTYGEID